MSQNITAKRLCTKADILIINASFQIKKAYHGSQGETSVP